MAKHWIVKLDRVPPDFRAASDVETAYEAVIQTYGMVTDKFFAKQVTLKILRADRQRKAAMQDPNGWTGFRSQYTTAGRLIHHEVLPQS